MSQDDIEPGWSRNKVMTIRLLVLLPYMLLLGLVLFAFNTYSAPLFFSLAMLSGALIIVCEYVTERFLEAME